MKPRSTAAAAVLASGLLALALTATTGAHATGTSGVLYLPDVLPRLDLATNLGPAPAAKAMTIDLALAHPDTAAEKAAYTAIYNPESPGYHQFLTPQQFDATYGVPAATVAAAEAWLQQGGLQIDQVSGSGDLIGATGTVGQLAALFRTPIESYRYNNQEFVANTSAVAIPATLPVAAVLGLNTLQQFHLADSGLSPNGVAPGGSTGGSAGGTTSPPAATTSYNGEFNAAALRSVYDVPATKPGLGQTLGILGEGDALPLVANLRVFEERENQPAVPVRVVHTEPQTQVTSEGGAGYGDVSGNVEWNLDSDASTGMAPYASQLVYYFAGGLYDADLIWDFTAFAGDTDPHAPTQASASFGECETNPANPLSGNPLVDPRLPFGQGLGDNVEEPADAALLQATLEGRTLFASTGDTGSQCPAVAVPVVGAGNGVLPGTAPFMNYPAVSPYAVAVGGTVVTATNDTPTAKRVSEVSWTYTGGGSSAFVAEPAYQTGITAIDHPCLLDASGGIDQPGTVCRGIPDIAADSSGGFPPEVTSEATYQVVEDMITTSEGGTSLSAPLADGLWTDIQAGRTTSNGFANEDLYRLAAKPATYARDFSDVTAAESPIGNGLYQPGPGWDYTSGLGALDVSHLMVDLDGRTAPTTTGLALPNVFDNSCATVFCSPAGNATDPVTGANDTSADFTSGQFSVIGSNLVVTMTGPGLAPDALPSFSGSADYDIFWTYAGKTYYAQATVSPSGVTYADGDVDPSGATAGGLAPNTAAPAGTFTAGRLQITLPLSAVGHPPAHATLLWPYGAVIGRFGASPAVYIPITIDAGSNHNYVVP